MSQMAKFSGRTSRFISSYLLAQKFELLVACRLSCTIKENVQAYYKAFKIANDEKNKGDLTPFVIIFLDIVVKSIEGLCESLQERSTKLKYYANIGEKLTGTNKKLAHVIFVLIQNTLFGDEGIGIAELCEIFKGEISEGTLRKCINDLKDKNLIKITKEGKKELYDIQTK